MSNDSSCNKRELLRLHREISITLRIQNPEFHRNEALSELIRETLNSLYRAGINEHDKLLRMTLIAAQNFVKRFADDADSKA